MGRKKIELAGKRFGRLTVIREFGRTKNRAVLWQCQCDCGCIITITTGNLRDNSTKSCGCLKKEIIGNRNKTHGMSGTPTYKTWKGMFTRCENQSRPDYKDYGGRGITVCDRWLKFENFIEDMGEKPPGLSIDRKDNNLGYFKENCRWATPEVQARNKRTSKVNKTGVAGVCRHKQSLKYQAYIGVKERNINLGLFDTMAEATEARRLGEIKYWRENL